MTTPPSRNAPSGSEALAELLRDHPPRPDDLARARMEKRLLVAPPGRALERPARSGRALLVAGGALALAAAVVLAVLAAREEPGAPVARFERREASASVERGTLEEGSSLRTAEDEVADIAVADSRVRIEGASRVRIAGLASERLALELDEGSVEVAFHPRARGSERMTVETPDARVEVVGTVFRVTARGGATEVSVAEGTVRVVPLAGGAPRLVHAGDSTRVARELAEVPSAIEAGERAPATSETASEMASETEAGEIAAGEIAAGEIAAGEIAAGEIAGNDIPAADIARAEIAARGPAPPDVEPVASTPAERLAEARRLHVAGRAPAALRMLRELTGPSVPLAVRVEAWELMGDAHQSAGRIADAARAYESAAREGRGTRGGLNAIYALARLQHRRLGDRDAARASYERYLAEAPRDAEGGVDAPLASQARRALCSLGATEHCPSAP